MSTIPTDRHITYLFQYRKCGKPVCRPCTHGNGHGPYFYGYWHGDDGKIHSRYVGKTLPEGIKLTPLQQRRHQESQQEARA